MQKKKKKKKKKKKSKNQGNSVKEEVFQLTFWKSDNTTLKNKGINLYGQVWSGVTAELLR